MKLGYLPDPPDPRDHPASDLLGTTPVPNSSIGNKRLVKVRDQMQTSACVGFSTSRALQASDVRRGVVDSDPSPMWIYKGARDTHGAGRVDNGTHIRAAMEFSRKLGYAQESTWPFDPAKLHRQPGFKAQWNAADRRCPTRYMRIYEAGSARVDAVKRALARGNLVVFGVDVDAAFMSLRADHAPVGPFDRGSIVGGHAMTLVEHVGDLFTVINSWGTGWGDAGFFSASADLVAWPFTRDLWIVDQEPGK